MRRAGSPAIVALLAALLPGLAVAAAGDIPPAGPYRDLARHLTPLIEEEVRDKGIPALAIALVDDQQTVWAQGFGLADPEKKIPASADTVFRVGSVSKLFTDLAIMRLVEQGLLDLDTPVSRYLPGFKPINPYDRAITLRQLMTHRSGLVRESPVGSYFDPTEPSLEKTVASLNATRLVYEPGTRLKYSNAAITVVGLVLQQRQKQPFARHLQDTLLEPLGMSSSSFLPTPAIRARLARAVMWTYDGREFPAPTFELGIAPAGCMYSTVKDLGRFLHMLLAGGRVENRRLVADATLKEMLTPQPAPDAQGEGFGIGFMVGKLDGRRRVGHGGAIYGFSTELAALPEERLGVVVISSRDVTNGVTRRLADEALRLMLARQQGKALPALQRTRPIPPALRQRLAGRYASKDRHLDLEEEGGSLVLVPGWGGYRLRLRALDDRRLVVDDRLLYGPVIEVEEGRLQIGDARYEPRKRPPDTPSPAHWRELTGSYGWDHNVLTILEKDGKLHALIEWVFLYPLEEDSRNVFRFPDHGLYHGEKLIFSRDEQTGRVSQVEAASVVFRRRAGPGEEKRGGP